MKITLYIIALLFCCCASAFARVGETLEQCNQRYGQPYKTTEQAVCFRKAPFYIIVTFYEGKADGVIYEMIERNALGKGADISNNEIEQLLKLNGADRQWKRRGVISMDLEWETQDGQLFAYYEPLKNYLTVVTKESMKRIYATKKQKEDKALEGF